MPHVGVLQIELYKGACAYREMALRSDAVINYNRRQLQDISCLQNKDEKRCERVQVSSRDLAYVPGTLLRNHDVMSV